MVGRNTTPDEFEKLVDQEGLEYACKEVAIEMMPGIPEVGEIEVQGDIESGFSEVSLTGEMVEQRVRDSFRDENIDEKLDNFLFETGYGEKSHRLIQEIEEELVEFYIK